ncbi:hypothetical protein BC629DRAFT_879339 [Irpex lacteus]|nr:hypothetical protein BC629DRAFT_879339 [Irpex lacteus]
MSTSDHKHSGLPPDLRGPSTCFLPNCAFIVQPQCPSCECKQMKSVSVDITASTQMKTTSTKPTVITRATTFNHHHDATKHIEDETRAKFINLETGKEEGPPIGAQLNQSLFESDSGTTWLVCDSCDHLFQVFINATISVVAAGPSKYNSSSVRVTTMLIANAFADPPPPIPPLDTK